MLSSRQRAYLRGLGNTIQVTTTIGKEGITRPVLDSVEESFNTRELVKIKLLENSGLDCKEASRQISETLRAECVQCIGSKIVLYKKFDKNPVIELPKK